MNRVAVTGLGIVCALGQSTCEVWRRLEQGESAIAPLPDPGDPPYRFSKGALARAFDPLKHFEEKELNGLERFAQFVAVAAREAVRHSGLEFTGQLGPKTAIITGSSVGGQFSEEEGYLQLYRKNNPRVAPLTIPRTMSNAGASRISLEHGIQGPTYTISTACSSSNHAIGQAFWMVSLGRRKRSGICRGTTPCLGSASCRLAGNLPTVFEKSPRLDFRRGRSATSARELGARQSARRENSCGSLWFRDELRCPPPHSAVG
jgi:3-oxoacyl-(acyl-carrier-protein) synthase